MAENRGLGASIRNVFSRNKKVETSNIEHINPQEITPLDAKVETNGIMTYGTTYIYDYESYFNYDSYKSFLRSPGANNYGLCVLAETIFNEVGFYANKIIEYASGLDIVPMISPMERDEEAYKAKDDMYDFYVDTSSVVAVSECLLDCQRYGVYAAYLDYKDKNNGIKRLIRLEPRYLKIIGNDGVSPIFGIDLFNVVRKEEVDSFPSTLRRSIRDARTNLKPKAQYEPKGGEVGNDTYSYLKGKILKIDPKRTIGVVNGDTRSATWGQIPMLKAIADIYNDAKIGSKITEAVATGEKNILWSNLPENTTNSGGGVKIKTVAPSTKGSNEQHESIKNAAINNTVRIGVVTMPGGAKLNLINIKDMFASYNSDPSFSRIAFSAGLPYTMLTGKAEGTAVANYTKNSLSTLYTNLVKFSEEYNKVYMNYKGHETKLVTLTFPKSNDYIRKDMAAINGKLFTEAGGSFEKYIASTGQDPNAYIKSMYFERDRKYDDIFKPHLTANNISADDQTSNRDNKNKKEDEE